MTDERTFGRFARKVAWPTTFTSCWRWTASRDKYGYGRFFFRGKRHFLAHRASYEIFCGPIPDGLHLDHLCRVRACVNPLHLEPVTKEENDRRGEGFVIRNRVKTHCVNGHPFSAENTFRDNRGNRGCRTCQRANVARYQRRRKARALTGEPL